MATVTPAQLTEMTTDEVFDLAYNALADLVRRYPPRDATKILHGKAEAAMVTFTDLYLEQQKPVSSGEPRRIATFETAPDESFLPLRGSR